MHFADNIRFEECAITHPVFYINLNCMNFRLRFLMKNNFSEAVKNVSDWIVDYSKNVEDYPVLSKSKPGELLDKLPTKPPEHAESFENIFEDFKTSIMPGITHWQ